MYEQYAMAGNVNFGGVANVLGHSLEETLVFAEVVERFDGDSELTEMNGDAYQITMGWVYAEVCQ